jgi:hypothetical protein
MESECVPNSFGFTQCNVQAIALTLTVKHWTPYTDSNGKGYCGAPYYSTDYNAGTCQGAVFGGVVCYE